jgi:predicted nucleic acid-binding protein
MLIDTNIFLEVQLNQDRTPQATQILQMVQSDTVKGYVTDYTIDSIALLMEHYRKTPDEIQTFLSSLLAYKGLEIYTISIFDRILATKHMQTFKLDYDDACQYQAMKVLKLNTIASFDKDFDRIKAITRITDINQLNK